MVELQLQTAGKARSTAHMLRRMISTDDITETKITRITMFPWLPCAANVVVSQKLGPRVETSKNTTNDYHSQMWKTRAGGEIQNECKKS